MVDDATFRSAVNTQRFLLVVFVVQIVAALMSSSFSVADKVVACVFWLGLAGYTCYQLFTPAGRARLRKQAKIGLPRTGLGLTLYWVGVGVMVAMVFVLMLVFDVPFWLLILASLPLGFALARGMKALTRWDARRFASKEFFFLPPPGEQRWPQR
ncbi:hypothetical protein [Nocardioides alkalitolerans]|uniref:hypothetical protein n=1 Tax=Nocardioides alkalitolerans TaxID=281714 RepID=UPI000490A9B2|nr:hypothetical protein [Nocardioides alkalitolerans]